MKFLRLINGEITFPYTLERLRKEGVAVSERAHPHSLAKLGVFHVHEHQKPAEPIGQAAILSETPVLQNGLYVLDWTVVDLPVDQARAIASAAMLAWISNFLGRFTAPYPLAEQLSWGAKEAAADAYLDGDATMKQLAHLTDEAQAKQTTVTLLATSITEKAELFHAIMDFASGLRSRKQKQIAAAQPADLQGILDGAMGEAMTKAAELGVI